MGNWSHQRKLCTNVYYNKSMPHSQLISVCEKRPHDIGMAPSLLTHSISRWFDLSTWCTSEPSTVTKITKVFVSMLIKHGSDADWCQIDVNGSAFAIWETTQMLLSYPRGRIQRNVERPSWHLLWLYQLCGVSPKFCSYLCRFIWWYRPTLDRPIWILYI